jgi:UDPglucose 6-dehydrogenase
MNIGIIGFGVVGQATAFGLKRGHKIYWWDKFKGGNIELIDKCKIIFICVPTPMKINGEVDISNIFESIEVFNGSNGKDKIFVIKSTATSGTIENLEKLYPYKFIFNPEFLTDVNAKEDFINSTRIVIGANDPRSGKELEKVYREAKFTCPIIHTNTRTAEMIKYASNVFLASQISVANEIFEICKEFKVDYDIVKNAVKFDDRIGKNIDVPGPDGKRGFGGKCFPKDLNALIYATNELGHKSYLLEEVWRTNLRYRKEKI